MHLNNKGFTLAEILVAGFVAAVAFVAILGTLSNITVLNELNQARTKAAVHAQYILEELRNANFSGLEADINNGNWDFTTIDLSSTPYDFETMTSETITTTVISSGDPLRIRVQVAWINRRMEARTFSLETLRTE